MPMRVKSRPLPAAREPSPMSVNWDANLLPDIGVDEGFREVIKKLSVYFAEVIQLPSTFEQLRTTTAGDSLRLLVDHLNATCTNPAIVNALLSVFYFHYFIPQGSLLPRLTPLPALCGGTMLPKATPTIATSLRRVPMPVRLSPGAS